MPGNYPIDGGGTAFFVSDRLAVVSRRVIRPDWREYPRVTLPIEQAHLQAKVVAENPACEIALLETDTAISGVTPVDLAREIAPGIAANAVNDLVAFYTKTQKLMPGAQAVLEPVVYDSAVKGLFLHGLDGLVTPSLKTRLRKLGLDLDSELRHQYPRLAWIRILAETAAELFPDQPLEEGYRLLGRHSIQGIGLVPLGKIIIGISRLLGPRRGIWRLPGVVSSLNNFMQMKVEELGPEHFRMFLNETYGQPAYMEGAIEAGAAAAGAKAPRVLTVEATAHFVSLEVRWAT